MSDLYSHIRFDPRQDAPKKKRRAPLNFGAQGELIFEPPNWYNPAAVRAEHAKYLRSSTWAAKREITKMMAGYYCEAGLPGCEGDKNLQVHHLNYKRWGDERPGDDIKCFCGHCHAVTHGKLAAAPPANDNTPNFILVTEPAAA